MLRNYLKLSIRNLVKHSEYSIINIVGLAIGFTCFILILSFVIDELSYDNFHKDADNIYRIALERKYPEHSTKYAIIPHSFHHILKQEFPEIENATRLMDFGNSMTMRYEDDQRNLHIYEEDRIFLADSNFFEFFDLKLISGNPKEILKGANNLVVTESTAKKYFGDQDPIGKIIKNDFTDLKVTGVCEDVPHNSHQDFDMLVSINSLPFIRQLSYISFSVHQYVQLNPNSNPKELEAKFPTMVAKYAAPQIEELMNISYEDYIKAGNGYHYFLQPIRSIHLSSDLENEMKPNGSQTMVFVFISISIFILVLACINFMNLATARSTDRSKEVGIRKTLGGQKHGLIVQFLVEAIVMSYFALMIAIVIVQITLPLFNNIAGKELSFGLDNYLFFFSLLVLAFIIGLLSGSYPAFVLSSYKPIKVLSRKTNLLGSGQSLRNGLVVFQFCVSIGLIAATIIVFQQLRFVQNVELGFSKERVLIIERAFALGDKFESFRNSVNSLSGVVSVSGSSAAPGEEAFFGTFFQPEGASEVFTSKSLVADENFAKTYQLSLKEGRFFSKSFNDTASVILNETAVSAFGLLEPVGTKLKIPGNNGQPPQQFEVIGVVEDFHFQSLHHDITPLTFLNLNGGANIVSVKISDNDFQEVIGSIESLWKNNVENEPFSYYFLNDELKTLYRGEVISGKLFGIFALLAIVIGCIGLLGLATFIAQKRTKEIGIRKAMGASSTSIILLLSKDFTRLILIALIISVPVSYLGMEKWLQEFAYKIDISPVVFILSGLTALFIAFLAVSFQSIKAALVNPVKSLRYE